MKRSPDTQRVVDRMKPGVLSLEGFLGADARPLEEILDADASAAARLNATHAELAAALRRVFEKARAGQGTDIPLGGHVRVRYDEQMGRIPCPFGAPSAGSGSHGCGTFQKGEVTLVDAAGRVLRFSALSVHLIAEHGFYGGRDSRYRIDPAEVAAAAPLLG